ncbi:non-homologous end-joining factor 1 isoform 1-T3 [Pholidichthys leucotaenia]
MDPGGAAHADDVLLQHPWLPVNIGGCELLAKSWFGDTVYRVLLTDMHGVWEERMDAAAIERRAQELNKRLRAPVSAFFSHLCEVAQPCLSGGGGSVQGDAQISLTRQQRGDISVKLKSELAGLPFYWEFHCSPAPVALVCSQLVRPLLTMSRLLQRQVEQLESLLLRKDAEIQDYRENGATLSRERLQTDVFQEQTFREDFMAKTLPLLSSEQHDTMGFSGALQQLYAAIVTPRNSHKRKLSEVAEDRPCSKKPGLTTSGGGGSVGTEPAQKNQNHSRQVETSVAAARGDRSAVQQSVPATSEPAERPSSKPKKKKVGLFR